MDNRSEIRAFLATRRAKLTPEQTGPERTGAHSYRLQRRPGAPPGDGLRLLASWAATQSASTTTSKENA